MKIRNLDVMVFQMTNDELFESLIKFHCVADSRSISEHVPSQTVELSVMEENIIRYASGYVPKSLIKQF